MRAYVATTVGRFRWWTDPDGLRSWRSLLEPLLRDPDRALCGWASFARARAGRKRFYHVRPADGPLGLFIKVFGPPSRGRGWLPSRARHEARVAQAIQRRGLSTAAPIAFGEERRAGRIVRSFSVIAELPARDLRSLLMDPSTDAMHRRELVRGFGAFTRRLHDAGVDQDDTSPNNFLVDADGRFVLIDFERCRVGRSLRPNRRWRLLAKLHRHDLGVSAPDRLRFLRAYLASDARADTRRAWVAIQRSLRAVRRRDARRAARGAFQVGRHVAREGDTWWIRGREEAPVIHVPLPPHEARRVWILSQQLERLGLPALRPVRLTPSGVDLLVPEVEPETGPARVPSQRAVDRALRQLERFGTWRSAPEWVAGEGGAVLRDVRAFELRMSRSWPCE